MMLDLAMFLGGYKCLQDYIANVLLQVIRISEGVQCRGATLRDLGSYAVCITAITFALHSGYVSASLSSSLELTS
jgi:hypothetical protein